jgi:pilus assembly protein Flp/PilA
MQELILTALTELRTRLSVRDESGQAMVEYGILVALISVAALAFIPGIGTAISGAFESVSSALAGAL